ncbi:hypothetical protein F994_00160 [Acinetobacter bohemicus ANC 3994]|uniref:Uncharacterized protein n=1 Tax=Acinetobacter bohemicus ANC 3994 TaxID=1217715 RepID=N8P3Y1_9GAMM|nr:hypothetical protein [Acinetobacter bohemicus]ENU21316.1 hypothetical protein F994_00160 [Acinetobacter bohemicus ANC 3994]
MSTFNTKNLIAKHAIIFSSTDSEISIHIFIEPFIYQDEIISPTIRLDNIDLPSTKLCDLANRSFTFTQEDINGSIFLDGSHHPVDVLDLSFFLSRQNKLTIVVKGIYVFEYEGFDDLPNEAFVLSTLVSSCDVNEQ